MIYIFLFKGIKKIEESKHSLPEKLILICLEDGFLYRKSSAYTFRQLEEYEIFSGDVDNIVLNEWRTVLEDVLYEIEYGSRLIFLSERDFRLFNAMKAKFSMHTGALGYYSLEAMAELADCEESKSEFSLIKENLKERYRAEAAKGRGSGDAGSLEKKIETTCSKYGMKVEMKSGIAYVTTYAGEWYFSYNDRPITLYHKNSIPVKDRKGALKKHSHVQPVQLYSPLHALAYIKNHEAAEEKRLMDK